MPKMKMEKRTLLSNTYIRDKFKSVKCPPLKAPDVTFNCEIELDANSDGALELTNAARKNVKKYIDDRVGIVVDELPKMAHKVEVIAEKYCHEWGKGKPQAEIEKKLDAVLKAEIKAHNTMFSNAMMGIESGVPSEVEKARKEVAKRKSAMKKAKIKTFVKVGIGAGITLGVTIAALIAIVGGVVATIATGGIAAIVFAAIGAGIMGIGAVIGGVVTVVTAMSAAGGTADKALADLKKSMKAVNDHKLYTAMCKLPDEKRKAEWKKLQTKFSPAFGALEVKVKNYKSHIFKAIEAGSKANNLIEKMLNESDKLDARIKKEIAKNKDAAKEKDVKKLIAEKKMFAKGVDAVIKKHSHNMSVLEEYRRKADEIEDIVADYKQETPPALQVAFKILATIKEIAPSIASVKKLVDATKTTATGMADNVKKVQAA